jgi:hypothetical protein
MLRELDALARAGHRGHVHIVDDNFIGNRRDAARFLGALAAWGKARRYPFFFGVNATISLADDAELLALMRAADVRFVFCGIETPDRDVLLRIHKEVNTRSPIVRSVHRLQASGLVVTAGFIMGFDHESPRVADEVIACVEESGIVMALVGLLVALPATQLGRRLAAEGRFTPEEDMPQGRPMVDQTTEGLNFRTLRPSADILKDYATVLRRIYHPASYFARARATALRLPRRDGYRPSPRELLRLLRAFGRVVTRLGLVRGTARHFWGTVLRVLLTRPSALEDAFVQIALYVHLGKQVGFLVPAVEERARKAEWNTDERGSGGFARISDPSESA